MPDERQSPRRAGKTSGLARSRERTGGYIAIQTMLGLLMLGVWVLVLVQVHGDDLAAVLVACVPYFACYEFGVLSRYIPGVRTAAKKLG